MIFRIEEIFIGDEVTFFSAGDKLSFNEFWKVTGKTGNTILIELKMGGKTHFQTLDIKEVKGHILSAKRP